MPNSWSINRPEHFQKLLKALFFCPAPKMKEAASFEGASSCFSDTPHQEAIGGGVLGGYGYAHRASWQSYPWTTGFFFGNVELSMKLWTVISGISGFDD